MLEIILSFCTQEHKDTIDLLKKQLKGLEKSYEEILTILDADDITPIERQLCESRLDTYLSVQEEVNSRIGEYENLRKIALN